MQCNVDHVRQLVKTSVATIAAVHKIILTTCREKLLWGKFFVCYSSQYGVVVIIATTTTTTTTKTATSKQFTQVIPVNVQ
jgi:hypothetical protein